MTTITFPLTLMDMKLKELVWKLDREVWAHVPGGGQTDPWTTSKAREESAKLIAEYFGSMEWIPIRKDKPPTGECLLLTSSKIRLIGDLYEGKWRVGGHWRRENNEWISDFKFEDITHYMELPSTI